MSNFQPLHRRSSHSTTLNGSFVWIVAGSGAGQDGNIANAWSSGRCWQMKLKCFWSLFRYSCWSALHVLGAFDPHLADYTRLQGLDRPTCTDVNEPYTQKTILIPVVPMNHVVSYDGQITGVELPKPHSYQERSCISYTHDMFDWV